MHAELPPHLKLLGVGMPLDVTSGRSMLRCGRGIHARGSAPVPGPRPASQPGQPRWRCSALGAQAAHERGCLCARRQRISACLLTFIDSQNASFQEACCLRFAVGHHSWGRATSVGSVRPGRWSLCAAPGRSRSHVFSLFARVCEMHCTLIVCLCRLLQFSMFHSSFRVSASRGPLECEKGWPGFSVMMCNRMHGVHVLWRHGCTATPSCNGGLSFGDATE